MHRKVEGDAAAVANAGAYALRQFEVMTIARAEIGTGLRDADDRAAGGQFGAGEPVIEIALEIERCHSRIVGIVEPQLRAQLLLRVSIFRHHRLRTIPTLELHWQQDRHRCAVNISPFRDANGVPREKLAWASSLPGRGRRNLELTH